MIRISDPEVLATVCDPSNGDVPRPVLGARMNQSGLRDGERHRIRIQGKAARHRATVPRFSESLLIVSVRSRSEPVDRRTAQHGRRGILPNGLAYEPLLGFRQAKELSLRDE